MRFLSSFLSQADTVCRKTLLAASILTISLAFCFAQGNDDLQRLSREMTASWAKGDFNSALAAAERVLQITVAQNGKTSPQTATALRNRAMIAEAKGDIKLATKSYDEAVDILKSRKDSLTPAQKATLADILEGLGTIRAKQDIVFSERIFQEALELRQQVHGPEAVETATPLVQLANVMFWKRDFKRSAEYYSKALPILGKSPNASKEDTALVYYRTQCSYRRAKIEDEFVKFRPILDALSGGAGTPLSGRDMRTLGLVQLEVVNGKAKNLVKPEWPTEGKLISEDGDLLVDVLINEKGNVISACSRPSKRPLSTLEESEIAAYKSTFEPTTVGGTPVKVFGGIVYKYRFKY
jgi:tetratricopeptide (TPR) repeat protein